MTASENLGPDAAALRARVAEYLRAHHTMTVATAGAAVAGATVGPPLGGESPQVPARATGSVPRRDAEPASPAPVAHAASVFYAVDDQLRLVFLSKTSSLHGEHIAAGAGVAVTVTESYDDWEKIQGVQAWGEAKLLAGAAKAGALALYVSRFPFVRDIIGRPSMVELMRGIGVYRVEPTRVAFTDNLTGVFGREVLDLSPLGADNAERDGRPAAAATRPSRAFGGDSSSAARG